MNINTRNMLCALALLSLNACATPYQKMSFDTLTGGYSEKEIEPGFYRVEFSANGHATTETAQTYWLYRCAELAMEKGYDGFQIMSDMQFVKNEGEYQVAARGATPIYIPMYTQSSPKPHMMGDIKLLKGQVKSSPPKIFNAAALKEELDPLITGERCEKGNVCPHVKRYLGRK